MEEQVNAAPPDLAFTPEIEELTRPIYERVKHVIPDVEWPIHAPLIAAINDLKRERNVIVLAHNYQTPEIFYGVGDITGDESGARFRAGAGYVFYDAAGLAGLGWRTRPISTSSPSSAVRARPSAQTPKPITHRA